MKKVICAMLLFLLVGCESNEKVRYDPIKIVIDENGKEYRLEELMYLDGTVKLDRAIGKILETSNGKVFVEGSDYYYLVIDGQKFHFPDGINNESDVFVLERLGLVEYRQQFDHIKTIYMLNGDKVELSKVVLSNPNLRIEDPVIEFREFEMTFIDFELYRLKINGEEVLIEEFIENQIYHLYEVIQITNEITENDIVWVE